MLTSGVRSRLPWSRKRGGKLLAGGVALLVSGTILCAAERQKFNFNTDWRFTKSDPAGAAERGFADDGWKVVSTPHTFNDTDTFDDWSLSGHRGEQNQWSGRTWYRKSFVPPDALTGKRVFVEFEAVRQVAEVYLNGKLLGTCKTGFTPFGFDLTSYLRFGETNVLAVMCDNRFMQDPWEADGAITPRDGKPAGGGDSAAEARSGSKLAALSMYFNATIPDTLAEIQADQIPWNNPHWHPAHGGIYRNVYLHVTDPLHFTLPLYSFLQTAGPYVYAKDVSAETASVHVELPVQNDRPTDQVIELQVEFLDAGGKSVLKVKQRGELAGCGRKTFHLSEKLKKPRLWEPALPHLYRVVCSLRVKGETVDTTELSFGVRALRWDTQTGFHINDKHLKLRGWGLKPTEEWPGLGAAQPDWVHFYTMQLVKEAGGNFVRWGHCAGGPASILAADQLGIITDQPGVDGEADTRGGAWALRAAAFRDVIIYFRNNPSVAIWEGGNQKVSREHAQELRALVDKYDPEGGRVYAHRRADKTTAEFIDIGIGTEGGREISTLPVVEGEYNREESPRRVWDDFSPPKFGYAEAKGQTYQLTSEQFAVNQVAQFVRKLGGEEHSGGANWIFSDSTSGGRVTCEVARTSGEVDAVRLPKEAYYACRSMFRGDPQIHIIGHWNYPTGTRKPVYVVANGEEVELFVNGKSQSRVLAADRFLFTFPEVQWESGEIKAVSYVGGKVEASQVKRTTGEPVALKLTAIAGPDGWWADGSDVAFVDVEIVDAAGERCPTEQRLVSFALSGVGQWLGGYESGRTNSIRSLDLDVECGINRVAIRASRSAGLTTIVAHSDGLRSANISIPAKSFGLAPGGFTSTMPQHPPLASPAKLAAAAADILLATDNAGIPTAKRAGQFTTAFSYSGPAKGVRVERNARDGKVVYADRDYAFTQLPGPLMGADYVCAANGDKTFSAEDLMELRVKAGSIVFVAHDDRLPRPAWLTRQFATTDLSVIIQSQRMRVFQRRAETEESLTLGPNTENPKFKTCNMYVVFVKSKARMLAVGSAGATAVPGDLK